MVYDNPDENIENDADVYFSLENTNDVPVPYSLIGSQSSPFAVYCLTEEEEIQLENFREFYAEDASILTRLVLPPQTEDLFVTLLRTNYGILGQNISIVSHHGSLYDLFRHEISEAFRSYLNLRLENYGNAYYVEPTESFFTFPDTLVPYWSGDTLFPVCFRSPFV